MPVRVVTCAALVAVVAVVLALAGCTIKRVHANSCELTDPALAQAPFVIATAPSAGARVRTGFRVSGCLRTDGNIAEWRLTGQDGGLLAQGQVRARDDTRPERFLFAVDFTIDRRQIAELELTGAAAGTGALAGRMVLPLVLMP